MEKMVEKEHVCKFCKKKFTSGKSLGGHIRIHMRDYSVDSDSFNGKNRNKKRLLDQREITALKQPRCKECGKGFDSLKALGNHMDGRCEGEKMVIDSHSDTETSSGLTRKRSKSVMKQSNSESFSNGNSSFASELDQEDKKAAEILVMMSNDTRGRNLVVNSRAESSENKSEILETKLSSGEQLKTDKVTVDEQLRSADDDGDNSDTLSDSYSSDSDYYVNGPKKSDSGISVDGSHRKTKFGSGFNKFSNGDERGVKEGGSKYELSKSKSVSPFSESDSCADTNSKFHKSSHGKSPVVKRATVANKSSKVHECSICFKVFKSGQALGGHKRSHSVENQEHRVKHRGAGMQIDLNLPATDTDE